MVEATGSLLLDALAPAGGAAPAAPAGLRLSSWPEDEPLPLAGQPPPEPVMARDEPARGAPPAAGTAGRVAWVLGGALGVSLALALTALTWQRTAPPAPPALQTPGPLFPSLPWPVALDAAEAADAPAAPPAPSVPAPPAETPGLATAVTPPRLRISVAPIPAPSPLVAAHAAYGRGELAAARQAYLAVLGQAPQHPDALLGLAAIAERSGDAIAARAGYAAVLALDPAQWAARASLWALPDEPGRAAARAGRTAPAPAFPGPARNPEEDARRRDALGRAAAAAGRWAQARAHFAAALAAVPEAADYAYALAVSLDQLGLRTAAAAGYHRALGLQARRPAGFAPAAARARLAVLAPDGED